MEYLQDLESVWELDDGVGLVLSIIAALLHIDTHLLWQHFTNLFPLI
jgi:hypothetical protein